MIYKTFGYVFLCVSLRFQSVYSQIGRKSEEKCIEYNQLDPDRVIFPDIIGGTKASENEFPHMAALGYGNGDYVVWACGGSLVSENFVLTAAHCLQYRYEGKVKLVRLGTKNIERPEPSYKDVAVAQALPHPEYKRPARYYDIALLRLSSSVKFSRKIKPACLAVNPKFDESTLTATGWGLEYMGGDMNADLMKVHLLLYKSSICGSYFRQQRILPRGFKAESMICAGSEDNESRDTCQGDSGGPLQIFTDAYYIVGVTSFGIGCGLPKVPSIYTRVSYNIAWIEKTVWYT